ncbi:uroporphyrinogen III synthase [Amycolatopsis coloradensis]|uniref:Uroporphyrinogen III synthase n=2 Tax=Amycolatopsis coloradensis TaxID=76021 RepID=A0A1R0KQD7_9PSEU|nr:uroporphyrinogen-III synthase [Amycolatopsis coloradensis]OLZ49341.1 uroporphyrinogen III synthase [Amycolatopsis coloradensis]
MADLSGITIGITAERRADDFIAALERHGATVLHAPTIRIVPLPDDTELRAATDAVLAEPVGFTAVTTGAGFRGWLSAAEGWGLREPLLERLAASRIFVRGPKAAGAVRGEGLREEFSAPEESNAELFEGLRDAGVGGARVAVQLHGTLLPELTGLLRDSGADVVQAQPYRWLSPSDVGPVHDLVESVVAGRVGALAFTSAPAAANLLALAGSRREELLAALRGPVLCACVGPVTAAPLEAAGVPTVQPERQRLGALVKLLVAELRIRPS